MASPAVQLIFLHLSALLGVASCQLCGEMRPSHMARGGGGRRQLPGGGTGNSGGLGL